MFALRKTIFKPRLARCSSNVLKSLEDRGLLAKVTSTKVFKHVETPSTIYLGVDPSAPSLHVGNLIALIALLHFRIHGHSTILLIGGATGSIGDPSGRSTERKALSPETLKFNSDGITAQVKKFFKAGIPFAINESGKKDSTEGSSANLSFLNNVDWTKDVTLLDFLRTVGKNARMSTMLARESVKSRLSSESGLSFTEFSYQLLQASDFLHLYKERNCTIQLGGTDQLGNIQSGIDLIRRAKYSASIDDDAENMEDMAFGVTIPLLTTSAGEKFGKSAGNAIWLDPQLTSPFDFYQFFLRTSDEDVLKYLRLFSFAPLETLEKIGTLHLNDPSKRVAQRELAAYATHLVHGQSGLDQANFATHLAYGVDLWTPSGEKETSVNMRQLITGLDGNENVPSVLIKLSKNDFLGRPLVDLIMASGLFPSKSKAFKANVVQVNNQKVAAKESAIKQLEERDLNDGLVVLKSGKIFKFVLLE